MVTALTYAHAAVLLAAATLFVAAAVTDVRSYRIPNAMCAALSVLFPLYIATAPHPVDWRRNLLVFGVVLGLGFAAFVGNLLGAGDVKLLSVAGLWAGPAHIVMLMLVIAFAGGLQSLALTAWRLKEKKPQRLMKTQIPYGVAIAAGSLAMLGMMFHPLLLLD
jgi:Flp pilus assembly protein protease CpaA